MKTLMTTRRRFLETVGGGLTGSCLARALPLGVGVLGWPRAAHAVGSLVSTECMRLDTNDLTGWQPLDSPASASGTIVQFSDSSNADVCAIYLPSPCAAPGLEVDVVASFQVRSVTPNNADGGFRVVINDGRTKSAIASCAIINNQRVIALAGAGSPSDAGTYPAFVVVDWIGTVTFKLRRWADGSAEILEVNGTAPNPRVYLRSDQVAPRTRAGASFEIGCMSAEGLTNADVTKFYAEMPPTPIMGALDFTDFRIRDTDSADRLRFRADFALGAGSDGIDPSIELVAVRVSTPTYGQFYPARTADFNPLSGFDVQGRTPRRRWSLNTDERIRTRIERLDFDENPNQTGAIVLRDLWTSLPDADYSTVIVMVDSGLDLFTETLHLVEKRSGSGQWRLPR